MTCSVKLLMIEKPVIYAVCYVQYHFIWYFEHCKDIDPKYNDSKPRSRKWHIILHDI